MGATTYGCALSEAREIIALRPMTRLPGSPRSVRGLINMRGTIVTVLDLGVRLDDEQTPLRDGSILLVRHHERVVGLVVSEVLDVRPLEDDGDASGAGAGPSRGIVRRVAATEDGAVVVLDLEMLISQVLLV